MNWKHRRSFFQMTFFLFFYFHHCRLLCSFVGVVECCLFFVPAILPPLFNDSNLWHCIHLFSESFFLSNFFALDSFQSFFHVFVPTTVAVVNVVFRFIESIYSYCELYIGAVCICLELPLANRRALILLSIGVLGWKEMLWITDVIFIAKQRVENPKYKHYRLHVTECRA